MFCLDALSRWYFLFFNRIERRQCYLGLFLVLRAEYYTIAYRLCNRNVRTSYNNVFFYKQIHYFCR